MVAKFFGKFQDQLKLQHQLLLLLLLSSTIPVSIVGLYGIFSSTTALSNLAQTKLEQKVTNEAENILAVLEGINKDVLFLSKTPPIQGIIRSKEDGKIDKQDNSSSEAWTDQLQ